MARRAKLMESQVHEVFLRLAAGELPGDIAAGLGVHHQTIRSIEHRRSWKRIGRLYPIISRTPPHGPPPADRGIEIGRRAAAGESLKGLASEFHISRQRVHQLAVAHRRRHPPGAAK